MTNAESEEESLMRRSRRFSVPVIAVLAVAAVLLPALPASAILPYRPDAMINPEMVGYVGQDVISTDGADQMAYLGLTPGGVGDFELAVQNEGAFADKFKIAGCASKRGYKVKYVVGDENVTEAVTNGRFKTIVMAPGGVGAGLHLRVKPTQEAKPNLVCDVTFSSVNEPAQVDVVRAKVERL